MYNKMMHRIDKQINTESKKSSCRLPRRQKICCEPSLKKKKKEQPEVYKTIALSDLYDHRLGPTTDSIFVCVSPLEDNTEGTNEGTGEVQECSQHITKGVESGSQLHYWYLRQGPLKRWLMCSFYNWQEDRTQSSVTNRYTMWR